MAEELGPTIQGGACMKVGKMYRNKQWFGYNYVWPVDVHVKKEFDIVVRVRSERPGPNAYEWLVFEVNDEGKMAGVATDPRIRVRLEGTAATMIQAKNKAVAAIRHYAKSRGGF